MWSRVCRSLAFALLFSLAAAALSPVSARSAEPDSEDRPNIIFIMVDDLGKEWIECYGAEGIETPHINALAAGGMKFSNAYCMPQCTPTRVTLLTGQYPFRHGWTNHWDVPRWGSGCHFDPKHNSSFAAVVRDAGYATCAAGKWQIDDFRVEPRAMHEAGFDQWCMWTGYETGVPASGQRYADAYINTNGKSRTHEGEFGPDVYCDFLIDFIRQNKEQPMLLYFPMALTHGPLVPTPDSPGAKGHKECFPGMVRYTDKLVGRLVAAVDELGLRERTIIIFTTDNGTGGGMTNRRNGRQVRGGKTKSVEAGTCIPFIVNAPGRTPSGTTTDALVDFTDILPTFAELSGSEPSSPRIVDGHSFAPLILGEADYSPRKWILSVGGGAAKLRDGRVVPQLTYDDRVLRDKRFKVWIDKNRKFEAFYDLQADPWEEKNLINSSDPEHQAARKKFAKIAAGFPKEDAAPQYDPNPPQAWDRKK